MLLATQATDPAGDDFMFWGKIGGIAVVALMGVAIWYFKGRRSSEP